MSFQDQRQKRLFYSFYTNITIPDGQNGYRIAHANGYSHCGSPVTGTALAISESKKPKNEDVEKRQMRKFTLTCWCEGKSPGKSNIHGGKIVLGDGKMWIQSKGVKPRNEYHPFEGFYLDYPDEQRPKPPPLGMVSKVSNSPPLMNWIYIDRVTGQVKHGNRTDSRPHRVGDWGWTEDQEPEDDDNEPGGIEFDSMERFVAVSPVSDDTEGRWEIWWDHWDTHLRDRDEVKGRKVYGISLERVFLD